MSHSRYWIIVCLVMLMLVACGSETTYELPSIALPRVMADQQAAWNAGDINGFMQGYTDSVCFISAKGTTCGAEAVTENYIRAYPDKEAMGRLSFGIGEVLDIGNGHAWCTGTWTLFRTADTLKGGYTLLWRLGPDGWRITRDHTY